jgi:hypothetical protein
MSTQQKTYELLVSWMNALIGDTRFATNRGREQMSKRVKPATLEAKLLGCGGGGAPMIDIQR